MIERTVNSAFEAIVPLGLHAQDGQDPDISTVVDTGFSGFLTLPPTEEGVNVLLFQPLTGRGLPLSVEFNRRSGIDAAVVQRPSDSSCSSLIL